MTESISSHCQGKSLAQWLFYLETIHSKEIDLGLHRIHIVAKRLDINFGFAKVITVAGTNGKGTTCAFLENALLAENKTVAVYSSPHIEKFNERLRVNKTDIDDTNLIEAFELIEQVRTDISLTYYEFTTLAAFIILMKLRPDYIILEVGLGGRLDATNLIDADIAVITTIDLDHQSFLGDTREAIGFEKAGILRPNGLSVLGDTNPPVSILNHAKSINALLKVREQDFTVKIQGDFWHWSNKGFTLTHLNRTNIPRDNVATALMVLALLNISLTTEKVNHFINITHVAGRTEMFKLHCDIMLDVAHNPQAARHLALCLEEKLIPKKYNKVYAIVGMLADKDISNSLYPMIDLVDHWYVASLSGARAASYELIAQHLVEHKVKLFNCFDNVTSAFKMACQDSSKSDLIIVFGSFYTVADIRRLLV